jgi:hypothetical protein
VGTSTACHRDSFTPFFNNTVLPITQFRNLLNGFLNNHNLFEKFIILLLLSTAAWNHL